MDAAAKKSGYEFSGVDKTGKIWGLRYSDFVVPLVKAVQEQQTVIDAQNTKLEAQQKEIDALKSQVESLAKLISK